MRIKYELIVEIDANELDITVMHEEHLQRKFDNSCFPFAPDGSLRVLSSRKIGESSGD